MFGVPFGDPRFPGPGPRGPREVAEACGDLEQLGQLLQELVPRPADGFLDLEAGGWWLVDWWIGGLGGKQKDQACLGKPPVFPLGSNKGAAGNCLPRRAPSKKSHPFACVFCRGPPKSRAFPLGSPSNQAQKDTSKNERDAPPILKAWLRPSLPWRSLWTWRPPTARSFSVWPGGTARRGVDGNSFEGYPPFTVKIDPPSPQVYPRTDGSGGLPGGLRGAAGAVDRSLGAKEGGRQGAGGAGPAPALRASKRQSRAA